MSPTYNPWDHDPEPPEPGSDIGEEPFNPDELDPDELPEDFDFEEIPPDVLTWNEFWEWFAEVYDIEGDYGDSISGGASTG